MTASDIAYRLDHAKQLIAVIDADYTMQSSPKTVLEQMRKSALTDLRAELVDLLELLETTQFTLVFIGQVGVGKTTAICHLTGLTAEREKKKSSKTGREKVVSVTEDLMATGSGFTTLCEVVVTPDEGTWFQIETYPREEVVRTINDFCFSIWNKVHPEGNAEEGGGVTSGAEQTNFPPELVRAVRNMIKMPAGDKRDDDPAIRMAREYSRNEFEEFSRRVLGRARLEERTQREFTCPKDEVDTRAWIKKTFDDLNLARLDTASIPRRISLHVDAGLLHPNMARIAAVVDTKGVDSTQFNREDLDAYIRNNKGAICVLAEGFDTAPTNVVPLLQRHVTPEAPLSMSKFALLVLPRAGEPEKAVGGHGPVGDYDSGISLRDGQIDETLSSRGLGELRRIFFDPLRHFEPAGSDYKLRSDSEVEEVEADRDDAWSAIFESIKGRENKATERVAHIGDSLRKIQEGKGLNQAEEDLVRNAKARISEHRHINLANADRFLERYRSLWEGVGARHPMILRATNNRFGDYPYRNIDIYYDAIPITEQLVRSALHKKKEGVLEIVRNVRNQTPDESDLRVLFAVLETRIDSSFEDMVREVGREMQDYLHDVAFHPQDLSNSFWVNVQSRFGRGPGYREDVLMTYADALEGHEDVLTEAAEKGWREIVIDPVLEYLG